LLVPKFKEWDKFFENQHDAAPVWISLPPVTDLTASQPVERDHRAIKRRCAPMMGFKSFRTAAITLTGVELAHRIRKRQFSFGRGRQRRVWSLKQLWHRALA